MIKITRSFAYKFFESQYNSRDFYCEQTVECEEKDADKISQTVHEWCKNQVIRDINNYKQELLKVTTSKSRKIEQVDRGRMAAEDGANDVFEDVLREEIENK